MKTVAILGGGDQENRRESDFYPTPSNVTQSLINFFDSKGISFCHVYEPASGEGDISQVFEDRMYEVTSSDLRTENVYGTGGIDFLTAPYVEADALITNPPFNVSEDFIRKAVPHYPIVAMLLKSQYWHAKNRIKLFKEFPPAYVLPLTWRPDFMEKFREPGEKGSPTMDVGWTVWLKGEHETKYQPLLKP